MHDLVQQSRDALRRAMDMMAAWQLRWALSDAQRWLSIAHARQARDAVVEASLHLDAAADEVSRALRLLDGGEK